MAMTVRDFLYSYTEFDMGRRKNQSRLAVVIRDRSKNKNVYGDELGAGTIWVRPEYRDMVVTSWTYNYAERKVLLFVE